VSTFRIQLAIEEIKELLKAVRPNKRAVFAKVTNIIEDIDTIHIVKKCTEVFPNDEDFLRLAASVLSNISSS
jgi:hypothetical protein